MENIGKNYEEQFISALFVIHERPGLYIGTPSLSKLLDYMTGYRVAVYDLTGYHITFERDFRQYLCQKYKKEDCIFSLLQFFRIEASDEEGFEAFFRELHCFCSRNG